MRQAAVLASAALALLLGGVLVVPAGAGIATDGTLGPAQALSGPDYEIPAALGTRAGENLFHSFQSFDILRGESATFTGPAAIAHVIGRVTGGNPSAIDGLLRSEIPGAEIYLINPRGVFFGPDAQVDVPAGLHVGAASSLQFADGGRFDAEALAPATLSLAPPLAFGFRDAPLEPIAIDRSELQLAPGSPLTLAAGTIEINGARLITEGGEVRLLAVGNADPALPLSGEVQPAATGGDLRVVGSLIDTGGDGGGLLVLRAQEAVIDSSYLFADNFGATAPRGGVDIRTGNLTLKSGAMITADSFGQGDGGRVSVTVDGLLALQGGGLIRSVAYAAGATGIVRVEAASLRVDGEDSGALTGISADVYPGATGKGRGVVVEVAGALEVLNGGTLSGSTFGAGDAGGVQVSAGSLRIDRQESHWFTGILSQADGVATGAAGPVEVDVVGAMEVLGGAKISGATFAPGAGGSVTVVAGTLRLDGAGSGRFTAISSDAAAGSTGPAGSVTVRVDGLLELLDGSAIVSDTYGAGDAGRVRVQAGNMRIERGETDRFTGVSSDVKAGSGGVGGDVSVTVGERLDLLAGGAISSSTLASGDAGAVTVQAGSLAIDGLTSDGFTGIASQANSGSIGAAGAVAVTVTDRLEIYPGGAISSGTFSLGDAGRVTVQAGSILIDRQGAGRFAGIASQANIGAEGDAGAVSVASAGMLALLGGAEIASGTFGPGAGGAIQVQAGQLRIDGSGSGLYTGISSQAEAGADGKGGPVAVQVYGLLEVLDGGAISSGTFGSGDAGEVSVEARRMRVDGGLGDQFTGVGSQANPGSVGNAGGVKVEVTGQLELIGGGSLSSATFATGDAGAVRVRAASVRIDGAGSDLFTGILTATAETSSGNAGRIEVAVAGELALRDQGEIASSALGSGDAGDIEIRAGDLALEAGHILTEAQGGDGGPITIAAQGALILRDSRIATSAFGAGTGGDIRISSGATTLDGGFVQANTAAGARGGDIRLNTPILLIPADQAYQVGGEERARFQPGAGINVIQAAAPFGESGDLDAPPLALDLSGALTAVGGGFQSPITIAESPCAVAQGAVPSALVRAGHGALPEGSAGGRDGVSAPLPPLSARTDTHLPAPATGMEVAATGCSAEASTGMARGGR